MPSLRDYAFKGGIAYVESEWGRFYNREPSRNQRQVRKAERKMHPIIKIVGYTWQQKERQRPMVRATESFKRDYTTRRIDVSVFKRTLQVTFVRWGNSIRRSLIHDSDGMSHNAPDEFTMEQFLISS
eukprot:Gregarina_sp_Poly_1__1520@NODE_1382_length_4251_cov_27_651291_g926_i0_p4_GENE_NODE_1382_length_4251_cov_27_651291_g926_i0NODE_1382_length_4251_cov_27_651291_g926_i0_p4_ORF_typecomplete_len127_score2_30_NODE_1382_length_4251_cov_27_651291_g926_i076456